METSVHSNELNRWPSLSWPFPLFLKLAVVPSLASPSILLKKSPLWNSCGIFTFWLYCILSFCLGSGLGSNYTHLPSSDSPLGYGPFWRGQTFSDWLSPPIPSVSVPPTHDFTPVAKLLLHHSTHNNRFLFIKSMDFPQTTFLLNSTASGQPNAVQPLLDNNLLCIGSCKTDHLSFCSD